MLDDNFVPELLTLLQDGKEVENRYPFNLAVPLPPLDRPFRHEAEPGVSNWEAAVDEKQQEWTRMHGGAIGAGLHKPPRSSQAARGRRPASVPAGSRSVPVLGQADLRERMSRSPLLTSVQPFSHRSAARAPKVRGGVTVYPIAPRQGKPIGQPLFPKAKVKRTRSSPRRHTTSSMMKLLSGVNASKCTSEPQLRSWPRDAPLSREAWEERVRKEGEVVRRQWDLANAPFGRRLRDGEWQPCPPPSGEAAPSYMRPLACQQEVGVDTRPPRRPTTAKPGVNGERLASLARPTVSSAVRVAHALEDARECGGGEGLLATHRDKERFSPRRGEASRSPPPTEARVAGKGSDTDRSPRKSRATKAASASTTRSASPSERVESPQRSGRHEEGATAREEAPLKEARAAAVPGKNPPVTGRAKPPMEAAAEAEGAACAGQVSTTTAEGTKAEVKTANEATTSRAKEATTSRANEAGSEGQETGDDLKADALAMEKNKVEPTEEAEATTIATGAGGQAAGSDEKEESVEREKAEVQQAAEAETPASEAGGEMHETGGNIEENESVETADGIGEGATVEHPKETLSDEGVGAEAESSDNQKDASKPAAEPKNDFDEHLQQFEDADSALTDLIREAAPAP
ncbi:hypothetical protein AB1Y20_022515 [Prymnesium parvum]|uniref:Uncharacterized protein n=1 Tax=Prymnesium parvum TaxID=97485 RepID=A0AB34JGI4_PRYPA